MTFFQKFQRCDVTTETIFKLLLPAVGLVHFRVTVMEIPRMRQAELYLSQPRICKERLVADTPLQIPSPI